MFASQLEEVARAAAHSGPLVALKTKLSTSILELTKSGWGGRAAPGEFLYYCFTNAQVQSQEHM